MIISFTPAIRTVVLFFVLLLLAAGRLLAQHPTNWPDSAAVLTRARADIAVLCSDSLAGRGYTHDGHIKAAHWLAAQYKAAGLEPLATGMGVAAYLQPFEFSTNLVRECSVSAPKNKWVLGVDYIAHPATGAVHGLKKAKIVDFGGVGIQNIDNYLPDNIKGRIVVLRPFPAADAPPNFPAEQLKDDYRIQQAIKRGAVGVVLLQDKLTASFAPKPYTVPVVSMLKSSYKPAKKMSLNVAAQVEQITSQNVVAFWPGEVADTAIVICGHYDHLGRVSDAIFYGANDNASGTAFLLATARALASQPKPKYGVLFIAFSAEEVGLIGSLAYVQNPLWPLSRTKAVLNFDLIGNGQAGIMSVGAKTYPDLFARFQAVNAADSLVFPSAERPNAANSDHYPFTLKNIPALFIYTQGGSSCYHDVCDKPENLQLPVFYNLMKLVVGFVMQEGQ